MALCSSWFCSAVPDLGFNLETAGKRKLYREVYSANRKTLQQGNGTLLEVHTKGYSLAIAFRRLIVSSSGGAGTFVLAGTLPVDFALTGVTVLLPSIGR